MELQLPRNLTEITNIFYHYPDKAKAWKQNGEKLVIKDGNELVAVFEPYDVVMTNDFVRRQNTKYENLWLPTWALYKSGTLKLYDKRFQHTEKGTIPLAKDGIGIKLVKSTPISLVLEQDDMVIEPDDAEIDYKKLMGDIGEKAVARFTGGILSENTFDHEKDGLINDHITFEVKTQRLIFKNKTFWIEQSQWNKLDSVDLLYFVKVPEQPEERAIAYLYYDTSVYNVIKYKGEMMREYPLTNCLFQCILEPEESSLLLEYSKKISTVPRFT